MASKVLTYNDYTVGWVCALSKEQTAATAMLDEESLKYNFLFFIFLLIRIRCGPKGYTKL